MKTCKRCLQTKPLSDFGKLGSSKDGLQPACKECTNSYQTQKRQERSEGKEKRLRLDPSRKTREDGVEVKQCTRCFEEKELSEYYSRSGYESLYAHCKACHAGLSSEVHRRSGPRKNEAERVQKNRERRRKNPFYYNMLGKARKYGISVEEAVRLSTSPCEMCGTEDSGVEGATMFIDHNHATGQVRGGLCRKCNFYVGWRENHENLEEAYEAYSKKYGKRYS